MGQGSPYKRHMQYRLNILCFCARVIQYLLTVYQLMPPTASPAPAQSARYFALHRCKSCQLATSPQNSQKNRLIFYAVVAAAFSSLERSKCNILSCRNLAPLYIVVFSLDFFPRCDKIDLLAKRSLYVWNLYTVCIFQIDQC